MSFTFYYVLYETLVFAVEAAAYALLIKKISSTEHKQIKSIGYAFVANAASFALGLGLAHLIPGIF